LVGTHRGVESITHVAAPASEALHVGLVGALGVANGARQRPTGMILRHHSGLVLRDPAEFHYFVPDLVRPRGYLSDGVEINFVTVPAHHAVALSATHMSASPYARLRVTRLRPEGIRSKCVRYCNFFRPAASG